MKIAPLRQAYKKSCGPACLAMAAQAFGRDLTEREIIRELGGLRSFGVCTVKLAAFAKTIGIRVTSYSLTKKERGVKRRDPKCSILEEASPSDHLVLLTVDPAVLAGGYASGRIHNILLTRYGLRQCRYADPADGKMHQVARTQLLAAWGAAAPKASAHAVVLGRNKRVPKVTPPTGWPG